MSDGLLADLWTIAANGGDDATWQQFIEREGAVCLSICRSILSDDAMAEEAVQDTLLYLRDHAGSCRAEEEVAARAWLKRIACTAALQVRRRHQTWHKRRRPLPEDQGMAVTTQPEERLDSSEQTRLLREQMELLEVRHQEPLHLHFFAGLDYPAMAQALGCTVNHARVKVHRAVKALDKRLRSSGLTCGIVMLSLMLDRLAAIERTRPVMPLHLAAPDSQRNGVDWQLADADGAHQARGLALAGLCCLVIGLTLTGLWITTGDRPATQAQPPPAMTASPALAAGPALKAQGISPPQALGVSGLQLVEERKMRTDTHDITLYRDPRGPDFVRVTDFRKELVYEGLPEDMPTDLPEDVRSGVKTLLMMDDTPTRNLGTPQKAHMRIQAGDHTIAMQRHEDASLQVTIRDAAGTIIHEGDPRQLPATVPARIRLQMPMLLKMLDMRPDLTTAPVFESRNQ